MPGTTAHRVLVVLNHFGLLAPEPRLDADERWITTRLATFPDRIAAELHQWVTIMRGGGRRRRKLRSWALIRSYLHAATPALTDWSHTVTSLREITEADIRAALRSRTGAPAKLLRSGLTSIFRALKQERTIFHDPTRTITMAAAPTLPTAVAPELLRGLIERAASTFARLVVALVAIHALRPSDVRQLRLDGIDTGKGRLTFPYGIRSRTVYLDAFTHRRLLDWLQERRHRWPTTVNPYLLTTAPSAVSMIPAPVSADSIGRVFQPLGIHPSALRRDRILDEARTTADPVHLIQVFGLSTPTALAYLTAAHPDSEREPVRAPHRGQPRGLA